MQITPRRCRILYSAPCSFWVEVLALIKLATAAYTGVDSLASFIFLYVETSKQHDGLVLEQSAIHWIWRIYRSTKLN